MQIDYDSGEPVYLQIARLLRDQIIQGELQVGAQLPSGNEMQASRGVTRVTYQHAVDQLREAGLVVTRVGKGTFVVAVPMLQVIGLAAGDEVTARMPTEAEREQLDTGLTPVLVVTRADGAEEVFPAAVTVCQANGPARPPPPTRPITSTHLTARRLTPRPPHRARPAPTPPPPPRAPAAYRPHPPAKPSTDPPSPAPHLSATPSTRTRPVAYASDTTRPGRWRRRQVLEPVDGIADRSAAAAPAAITARSGATASASAGRRQDGRPLAAWRWRRPARGRGPVRPGCGRAGRPARGRSPRG